MTCDLNLKKGWNTTYYRILDTSDQIWTTKRPNVDFKWYFEDEEVYFDNKSYCWELNFMFLGVSWTYGYYGTEAECNQFIQEQQEAYITLISKLKTNKSEADCNAMNE